MQGRCGYADLVTQRFTTTEKSVFALVDEHEDAMREMVLHFGEVELSSTKDSKSFQRFVAWTASERVGFEGFDCKLISEVPTIITDSGAVWREKIARIWGGGGYTATRSNPLTSTPLDRSPALRRGHVDHRV